MILALQIFCIVVAFISFIGFVAEGKAALVLGSALFTAMAIAIEVFFK